MAAICAISPSMRLLALLLTMTMLLWGHSASGQALPYHVDPSARDLVPNLAVEVISEGNTPGQIKRKLKDYFLAGVSLVWFADSRERTVEVYTAPDRSIVLSEDDSLDGGEVLPGFRLPVRQLFAHVTRPEGSTPKPAGGTRPKRKPRRK